MTTIDQKLAELLNNWTVGDGWPIGNLFLVLISLFLCVILCGIVGFEREWKGRSAGLRTHLLVGVGSCVIMIISIYGFPKLFNTDGSYMTRDIARLAAAVVTGVGFLGAGAIIHRSSGIKGLTTAATIWAVMAIGLACGSFNFILAVLVTVVIVFVLIAFKKMEQKISERNPLVVLTAPSNEPILGKILDVSKEFDCRIHALSTDLVDGLGDEKLIECTFQVVFSSGDGRLLEYLSKLEKETSATSVKVLNSHR